MEKHISWKKLKENNDNIKNCGGGWFLLIFRLVLFYFMVPHMHVLFLLLKDQWGLSGRWDYVFFIFLIYLPDFLKAVNFP